MSDQTNESDDLQDNHVYKYMPCLNIVLFSKFIIMNLKIF